MTLTDPPHRLQTTISRLNTRVERWAKVMPKAITALEGQALVA
jgi:hypothetical protein